jgi:tRNA(Ile)-lysidine synthase TilS/MesJ
VTTVEIPVRLCTRCILPETFPNIRFDDRGVCNHCLKDEPVLAKGAEKKGEYRRRLDELIASTRDRAPAYDVIMAYSGGKDSSYTLKLLRERYGLRTLALTLDNHFVSPAAWENIRTVVDRLGVDLLSFRPSWPLMKTLFRVTSQEDIFAPATLLRASAVCTACIGIVKSLVLRTALEMSVPLVAFGWSPGQAPIQSAIMRTNPGQTRQNQKALKRCFPESVADGMNTYMIPEGYYSAFTERFPCNIHPLAFFDYDEDRIKVELETLGWQTPTNTDTNSTNCLLNAFANERHLARHGFHPYVWEIANMVRQGVMTREEGIEKIYQPQDPEMVAYARDKLDL